MTTPVKGDMTFTTGRIAERGREWEGRGKRRIYALQSFPAGECQKDEGAKNGATKGKGDKGQEKTPRGGRERFALYKACPSKRRNLINKQAIENGPIEEWE